METRLIGPKCGRIVKESNVPCEGTIMLIFQQIDKPFMFFDQRQQEFQIWQCSACGNRTRIKNEREIQP